MAANATDFAPHILVPFVIFVLAMPRSFFVLIRLPLSSRHDDNDYATSLAHSCAMMRQAGVDGIFEPIVFVCACAYVRTTPP